MKMKLRTGERYNPDTLRFLGWTVGDGTSTDGYTLDNYFDDDGRYLGPDQCGIEPIVEAVELIVGD